MKARHETELLEIQCKSYPKPVVNHSFILLRHDKARYVSRIKMYCWTETGSSIVWHTILLVYCNLCMMSFMSPAHPGLYTNLCVFVHFLLWSVHGLYLLLSEKTDLRSVRVVVAHRHELLTALKCFGFYFLSGYWTNKCSSGFIRHTWLCIKCLYWKCLSKAYETIKIVFRSDDHQHVLYHLSDLHRLRL